MEYEALIIIHGRPGDYEMGDIVAVAPKGHIWGRRDVKDFLIVNLGEMTEADAKRLVSERFDEKGKLTARRRYKVDVVGMLGADPRWHGVLSPDSDVQPLRAQVAKIVDKLEV